MLQNLVIRKFSIFQLNITTSLLKSPPAVLEMVAVQLLLQKNVIFKNIFIIIDQATKKSAQNLK